MPKNDYTWIELGDFKGGINLNKEECGSNQVLDVRNMWAPHGKLEQRPGYKGISWLGEVYDFTSGTSVTSTYIENPSGTYNEVSTYVAFLNGTYYTYVGLTDKCPYLIETINISLGGATSCLQGIEYFTGTVWKPLLIDLMYPTPFMSEEIYIQIPNISIDYTGLGGEEHIHCINRPNDWNSTIISSIEPTSKYWLRFKQYLVGNFGAAGAYNSFLGYKRGTKTPFEYIFRNAWLFNFKNYKKFVWINASLASVSLTPIVYQGGYRIHVSENIGWKVNINNIEKRQDMKETVTGAICIPNFDEALVSMYDFCYFVTQSGISLADVEKREDIVGSVSGVLSEYNEQYVPQLKQWPQAKYWEFYQGQLWAANFVDNKYMIRWSGPQPAYKVWPEESYEVVSEIDQSPITGLRAFGEHLALFKRDSIWKVLYTGVSGLSSLNTYNLVKVPGEVGTVSNGSIVDINNTLFFASEDGVYTYDGVNLPKKISDPIQDFYDVLAKGKMENCCAVHWKARKCYMLAVTKDKEYNSYVLVYDYANNAWWIWDNMEVTCWLKDEGLNDEEIVYFCDYDGNVFELGADRSDHGRAITSSVELNDIKSKEMDALTLREARVYASSSESSAMLINIELDNRGKITSENITLDWTNENLPVVSDTSPILLSDGATVSNGDARVLKKIGTRKTARVFSIKITNTLMEKSWSLIKILLGFVPWSKR